MRPTQYITAALAVILALFATLSDVGKNIWDGLTEGQRMAYVGFGLTFAILLILWLTGLMSFNLNPMFTPQ